MAKIIKNIDNVDHTYVGQLIPANSSYTIQGLEQIAWANCEQLFIDIANNKAIVNDGTSDITNVNDQINFLKEITCLFITRNQINLIYIDPSSTSLPIIARSNR